MPLSDREKHLLKLIEGGFEADDPRFASRVRRGSVRSPRSGRRRRGGALFVVGVVTLVTGVAARATMIHGFPILSVLGFAVMFGGAIVLVVGASAHPTALTTPRRDQGVGSELDQGATLHVESPRRRDVTVRRVVTALKRLLRGLGWP